MSKLPKAHKFVDLSDYGRSIARRIALSLKNTSATPVQVTYSFVISGIIAIACIVKGFYFWAAFFLILKSILDAADGELARVKNTPSYTGRYLDSISDILLNAAFIYTIGDITNTSLYWSILAFLCIQLQGTLYNYYYVILRNKLDGDTTSRVIEIGIPKALPGEQQSTVTFLYKMYRVLYGVFDAIIYKIDPKAEEGSITPNWLMTIVSTFGLGFQLLLIAIFLVIGLADYIIPFFIGYTIMIPILIVLRMAVTKQD